MLVIKDSYQRETVTYWPLKLALLCSIRWNFVTWHRAWTKYEYYFFSDMSHIVSFQRWPPLKLRASHSLNRYHAVLYSRYVYAAVNGHLEFTLLKGRQRFDAVSTSNLEVYKFRDWWIFTYFIFGYGESSPNNIGSMLNLERMCVLLFYYFLYLKVNLDLEKTNQLSESSPNFIFAVVNLDPIILEMRWINGESWPNDFDEKVNRGVDLSWVGSRCPLTRALIVLLKYTIYFSISEVINFSNEM